MRTLSSLETAPPSVEDPRDRRGRRVTSWIVAPLLYLATSVALWWHAWATGPSVATTCGCGDAARFLWFLEWPAVAIHRGYSLFFSTWLFHPTGINLLSDTSVLGLGLPLVPVTALSGPVATMNVASTLAPFLGATAMFFVLRRWVAWPPAQFLGGLFFGFSPLVIAELAYGQLNTGFLAVLPLILAALDELVIRQRRSWLVVGAALGALGAFQFFISTELLLTTAVMGVIGLAMVTVFGVVRHRHQVVVRLGHAVAGLVTVGVVAGALLAYPLWFLLRGPAHLAGPVWTNGAVGRYGNTVSSLWLTQESGAFVAEMRRLGGYQGPPLPWLGYVGLGVLVVVAAGTVIWRGDRRLWFFGILGLVALVLSLAPGHGAWVPWQLFQRLPWVGDIVEERFSLYTDLALAAMLALVLGHVRDAMARGDAGLLASSGRRAVAATVVPVAVAALAFVPVLVSLWPNLPLTMRRVTQPQWFAAQGRRLPPNEVLLTYPAPFSGIQASMAWQALDHIHYAMAGGGGPLGVASRAGPARPGFLVLSGASLPLGPAPGPTPSNASAVRQAVALWRVSLVVVPDQEALPVYERGRDSGYAVGLFTAVFGQAPRYQDDAWEWSAPTRAPAPLVLTPSAFDACVALPTTPAMAGAVPSCILRAGRSATAASSS